MKLTNKKGLPDAVVRAVTNDDYDKGECDISITGLLRPPQITHLLRKHSDDVTEDVADRGYALLGQAVHAILERAAKDDPDVVTEKRFYMSVAGAHGTWTVGGKLDSFLLKGGVLQDYKVLSIYKMKEGVPEEYRFQLNAYAELLRRNGFEVNKLQIVALYRDWSATAADREAGYPQTQMEVFDTPLQAPTVVVARLQERVTLHQEGRAGNPSSCSAEDRWARPDVYALMKTGRKSALKLYETEQEARLACPQDTQHYVQHRQGVNTRCEKFCPVRDFCPQRAESNKEKKGE